MAMGEPAPPHSYEGENPNCFWVASYIINDQTKFSESKFSKFLGLQIATKKLLSNKKVKGSP
jgi:hypothetical protein